MVATDIPAPRDGMLRRISDALMRRPRLFLFLLLGPPLLWLGIVYVGSLIALLAQSFFSIDEFTGLVKYEFTLKTYGELFRPANLDIIIRSVLMAAAVTLTAALIAFPIAYYAARYARGRWKALFYIAVTLPLWSSYLVRVYAWKLILAKEGILNWFIDRAGLTPVLDLILSIPVIGGPSLSISYNKKLKIVRGRGAYLFDHTGRAFVDGVNNICHVGHSHPHVVDALSRQAAILNTNTRYLHDNILDYAERLASHFPKPLSVVYLVCSGSEANELALRMARTVTGRRNTICVDWGYHGNTSGLIDVSPYKFNRKGGRGQPGHVEIAALPDPYRGPFKGYGAESGIAYATSVADCIAAIRDKTGEGPAAFIAEAISGCGGQVFFPDAYLKTAAEHVRRAGGLVIVDEVQTGFGRIGEHMWAHGPQDVVPDIVTLGKPIGNGHPMAAVITTPEIARAFANGMEFFSSFGGNPVSAAVGMAVLDVIEVEHLQASARETGADLKARLSALMASYDIIGDVRGQGLFLGVELVRDRNTLEPATEEAGRIANHMRGNGVLISTDGPYDNVLKIKPPLAFGLTESRLMAEAMAEALAAL